MFYEVFFIKPEDIEGVLLDYGGIGYEIDVILPTAWDCGKDLYENHYEGSSKQSDVRKTATLKVVTEILLILKMENQKK